MFTQLSRWVRSLGGAGRDPGGLTFTVYTRAGCSCCLKAIATLEAARSRDGFAVETIDVDSDPALADEYGLSVPVVLVNGKVRFTGQVNPVLLERLLAAEVG